MRTLPSLLLLSALAGSVATNIRRRDGATRCQADMDGLLAVAKRMASGKKPLGRCYEHVADYIDRAGYGGIKEWGFNAAIPPAYWPEAKDFAVFLNKNGNAARLGLENLKVSEGLTNPYDAPPGAIVVVRHGTPGTRHPTAGDIVVKGKGSKMYNDGEMGYGGPQNFPKGNTFVLGIYVPTRCHGGKEPEAAAVASSAARPTNVPSPHSEFASDPPQHAAAAKACHDCVGNKGGKACDGACRRCGQACVACVQGGGGKACVDDKAAACACAKPAPIRLAGDAAAVGRACTTKAGAGGTCRFAGDCTSGEAFPGACPGSEAVKCCVDGLGQPCKKGDASGTCKLTGDCAAAGGTSHPGLCEGPGAVQCCVSANKEATASAEGSSSGSGSSSPAAAGDDANMVDGVAAAVADAGTTSSAASSSTMDQCMASLKPMLIAHEGYEKCVYTDTTGHKTIGVGFNLEAGAARKIAAGAGVSDFDAIYSGKACMTAEQIDKVLDATIANAVKESKRVIPKFDLLCCRIKNVAIDMTFNLGSLAGWPNFVREIQLGQYEQAKQNLLTSQPWCSQVKSRCPKLANSVAKGC